MGSGPGRRVEVNWITVDGDVVLADGRTGQIHVLSGATSATWQLIDGEPLDGLADLIAAEFDITIEEAEAGLAASIEQLRSIDVVD